MKKLFALTLVALTTACVTSKPVVKPTVSKEVYPYNMTATEWNKLSVQDQVKLKRDFYFYEKGSMNLVDPNLDIKGKETVSHFSK